MHQPRQDNIILCIEIQSNLKRKDLNRTNQGSNLFGDTFSNRDNVKPPNPIQKRKSTPASEKMIFPQEQTNPFSD